MLSGFQCEFRRGHHIQKARRLVGLRDFDLQNDRKGGIFVNIRAHAGVLHAPFWTRIRGMHDFFAIFRYRCRHRIDTTIK